MLMTIFASCSSLADSSLYFIPSTLLFQEISCALEQCFSNLTVIWVIWGSH